MLIFRHPFSKSLVNTPKQSHSFPTINQVIRSGSKEQKSTVAGFGFSKVQVYPIDGVSQI